ncbi:MAG: sulfite exporter TauE/SafE family protein [Elusimicrobia bacterium]|nr:sulfite exporter TauE/SafE family protein [Elusimicrobiota bacterium]
MYSSVGHGGASGYLAILALLSFPRETSIAGALTLNILVASIAFVAFRNAGHFQWRLTWPFILGSVPGAYFGGAVQLSPSLYSFLLSGALGLAALRMWIEPTQAHDGPVRRIPIAAAVLIGTVIGLLSGMIGIGGGVFLSPLLLLWGRASAKQVSATSALFILVNSIAALAGHLPSLRAASALWTPYTVSAFMGGWLGSRLGSGHLSNTAIRRVLGTVLWLASFKLLYTAL